MTCWVSSFHSSHHSAKFVDLVCCESEGKTFLTCHVTTQLKWHVTLWVDFPHPKSPPPPRAKFGVHTLNESGNITFFICQVTSMLKCQVGFILRHPLLSFRSIGLVKVEIQSFLSVTWSLYWNVLWLCGWGPLILRHQLAKFGIHKPSESRDKRFLFVTWPQYRSVTWLCEWGLLILNHHPVRFGIHRSYETGANSVCSISSDSSSNSNSNVEVPMPRFINGH